MRLSFDDEGSFKEAVESLRFNNPNTRLQMGSSDSMPLEDSERNEDLDDITPGDPIPLRRVGSNSNMSIQEIPVSPGFNSPPSNPEFIGTSANVM